MDDLRLFCVTNTDCNENDSARFRKTREDELALSFKSYCSDTVYLVKEDIQRISDYLLEVHGISPKGNYPPSEMYPVEPSPTPSEPCEEVFVHGDWIIDINYRTNLGVQTKTYRLDPWNVEEEAVREAYTMFIAELGVEYSNSLLASADIVIMNAGKLPTPSYRTIKLN